MEFQLTILRDMIYGAAARGVDFRLLCQKANIDPQELNDAERMVPWEKSPALWEDLIVLSGDELIGLHMGQQLRPSVLGMIGHLIQTCRMVGDALEAVSAYNDLFSGVFRYSLQPGPNEVFFGLEPSALFRSRYPESSRQSVELSMSGILRILETLAGRRIRPLRAQLAYPIRQVAEYRRVLQCDMQFDAATSGLFFSKSDLRTPVTSYDQSLFALFTRLLQEKQKQLLRKTFAAQVRQALLVEFKGKIPSVDIMAAHLSLNRRTFQRRLAAEQTSYRALGSALRKELALALLDDRRQRVSDIALLLGYADHTSFRRAFRHWTSRSPRQPRQEGREAEIRPD